VTRCLMLDVDGVLVHASAEDGASWAADIERNLGIDPQHLQEAFFEPHWTDIVTGRKDLAAVLDACLPALAPGLSAQDFIDYWFERDSRIDAGVVADCDALRRGGLRIYLATNQEHLRAAHLMDGLGLRDHVDGIVYSARVGARKPERTFFDAALMHSGSRPENTLLVDDTLANVEAARGAGWQARHWTEGADLLQFVQQAGFR